MKFWLIWASAISIGVFTVSGYSTLGRSCFKMANNDVISNFTLSTVRFLLDFGCVIAVFLSKPLYIFKDAGA